MSMDRNPRNLHRQGGLSLIELMIALLVGLLLLGGLIQIYVSSKQGYNAQEQLARMQESGRFAMDLITRDLRRAGYWGGNRNLAVITGNPGPAAPAHTCGGDDTWGRMVEWRVSGVNQDAAPGDPGNEVSSDDPAATPAHMLPVVRRLVSHAYYIGDSGRSCGAAAIPALFRVRLAANGLPVTEQIAPGVEQLQVRYLVNGAYQDTIAAAEWPVVQAVRVWLLMRSECPESGLANAVEYPVGDITVNGNDGFRRQLYVSTVMLRNPMAGL
jgi:type IV pilus assembly protein PilW